MLSSVSYVYADKIKVLQQCVKKCLPSARTRVKCTPLRQRRVVNAAMQNVQQALLQNIAVMLNDVSSTQENKQ